jgi:hypothetical protein
MFEKGGFLFRRELIKRFFGTNKSVLGAAVQRLA